MWHPIKSCSPPQQSQLCRAKGSVPDIKIALSTVLDGELKTTDEGIYGRKMIAYSPNSVVSFGLSLEAPGRLESESRTFARTRSFSNDFCKLKTEENFCKLDTMLPNVLSADLPRLVQSADSGFKVGIAPSLVGDCMGGTYFLRDSKKAIVVVFKPSDEEPYAPQNPHQEQDLLGKIRPAYKGGIVPGFGMFREVAAFALDDGFSGVPPTHLAKIRHAIFKPTTKIPYKIGSVQSFVRSICTAEDMGPSMFDLEDIHRMAILDIRLCNLDRHAGNMLVCHSNPYQMRKSSSQRQMFSDDVSAGYGKFPTSPPLLDVASSAPSKLQSFIKDAHLFSSGDQSADVSRTESVSPPSSTRRYRLVPIDHGYCLPHILHIREVNLCWTEWAEADVALSAELRVYCAALDPEEDVERLRRVLGAAIPEECLFTLRVCTNLLKRGIFAGLTLREIGRLMSSDTDERSPLQEKVLEAVQRAVSVSVETLDQHRLNVLRSYQSGFSDTFHRSQTVGGGCSLASLGQPLPPPVNEEQLMGPLSSLVSSGRGRMILHRELDVAVCTLVDTAKRSH